MPGEIGERAKNTYREYASFVLSVGAFIYPIFTDAGPLPVITGCLIGSALALPLLKKRRQNRLIHLFALLATVAFLFCGAWVAAQPRGAIYGKIVSPSNKTPLSNIEVYAIDLNNNKASIAVISDDLGNFSIQGIGSGDYWVMLLHFTTTHIGVTEFKAFADESNKNSILSEFPKNKFERIAHDTIFFKFDSSVLNRKEKKSILELAYNMQTKGSLRDYRLLIHGHCCKIGTPIHNQVLGQRRAEAVRDLLVTHGVRPERLITASYGMLKPAETNSLEEENDHIHRRVELYLIPPSSSYTAFMSDKR